MGVNASIISDPPNCRISSATEVSNNDVLRSIAALSTTTITNLSGMTFSEIMATPSAGLVRICLWPPHN